MDSSDYQELFDSISCNNTLTKSNPDLEMEQTSNLILNTIKKESLNSPLIKDVSVKLIRLSNPELKNILFKGKKGYNKWRVHTRKLSKQTKLRNTEKFQFRKEFQKVGRGKYTANAIGKSLLNNTDEQACLYEQPIKAEKESFLDIQQDAQTNDETSSSSTTDTEQVKEESCDDDIYIPTYTLPNSQQERNEVLANQMNIEKYTVPLPMQSVDNEITGQNSYSNKCTSICTLPQSAVEFSMKEEYKSNYNRMDQSDRRTAFEHRQLDKRKHKRKDSSTDESLSEFVPRKKKRYRRIIFYDDDSDNEDTTIDNVNSDDQDIYDPSYEIMNKKKSLSNVRFTREIRIILTRLENMDNNIYVTKWRRNRAKNASQIISSKQKKLQAKLIIDINEKLLPDRKENPTVRNKFEVETLDEKISKRPNINTLDMKKLKIKYNLFRKPKVLIIKLEALSYFSETGKYSAIKIHRLTEQYIDSVMYNNFTSDYEFTRSRKGTVPDFTYTGEIQNSTGSDSSDDDISLSRKLFIEESLSKDNQVESIGNERVEDVPFKTRRTFTSVSSSNQDKCTSLLKNKDLKSTKNLLEVWRDAFCAQKPIEKPQNAHVKPSTIVTTLSSFQHILPKNSIDVKHKNIPSSLNSAFVTPFQKDNTSILSSREHISSQKYSETSPMTCEEVSISQSPSSSMNSPNISKIEKTACKSDSSQLNDNTVSKNLGDKNGTDENVTVPESFSDLDTISVKRIAVFTKRMHSTQHKLPKETQTIYKCNTCTAKFENHQLLYTHLSRNLCSLPDNTFKSPVPLELEEIIIDEESNAHTSSIQSYVDSDKEISSSSSSSTSSRKLNNKTEMINKCDSADLNPKMKAQLGKTRRRGGKHLKRKCLTEAYDLDIITCNVCSQVFDNYVQLSEHIFKHTDHELQSAYISIKNKIPKRQETDKVSDQVSESMEGSEIEVEAVTEKTFEITEDSPKIQKRPLKSATQLNNSTILKSLLEAQHDTIKDRNLSKLLQLKDMTGENLEKDLPVTENETYKIEFTEKTKADNAGISSEDLNTSFELTKPTTICECHRNEAIEDNSVQIEVNLFCNTCQVLFRRFECFETHYRRSKSALCGQNRRRDRIPKLFCSSCLAVLNSLQDTLCHLEMHARVNRNGMANFRCNICKVIFYGVGTLFKSHLINHMRNPFFMASRLSFPKVSCMGPRLIEMPVADSDKPMEIYIQIADYVCRECKKPFISKKALKSHKKVCQDNIEVASSPDAKKTISIEPKNVEVLLVCGFCNRTFCGKTSFEIHSLEHKQERGPYAHYICVAVSADDKVYVCKVCMTVCKSLKEFEEHWLTHGILLEDYVCTHCKKHYATINLFLQHATTHNNNNGKAVLCKVIYYDAIYTYTTSTSDLKTKHPSKHIVDYNDILRMSLSCFEKKESAKSAEQTSDRSLNPIELTTTENGSFTRIKEISTESSICNDEIRKNNTICANSNSSLDNMRTSNENNDNSEDNSSLDNMRTSKENNDNLEDNSSNKSITVISESEKSSMANEIREETDDVLAIKCHESQRSLTKTNSASVADGKSALLNDIAPIVIIDGIFNDINKNSSLIVEDNVTTTKESVILKTNDNASISANPSKIADENIKHVRDDNAFADDTVISIPTSSSGSSDVQLQSTKKSESKPFLRVKSLAELTNAPTAHLCHKCGSTYNCLQEYNTHMLMHKSSEIYNQQSVYTSSSHNSYNPVTWQSKPEFRPSIYVPASTSMPKPTTFNVIQDHAIRPIIHCSRQVFPGKVVVDPSNSRQYEIAGVKPLRMAMCPRPINRMMLPTGTQNRITWNTPQSASPMVDVPQVALKPPAYHQNLPAYVTPLTSKLAQVNHQNDNTLTVRPFVRPLMQTIGQPPKPLQLIYPQQQMNVGGDVLHNTLNLPKAVLMPPKMLVNQSSSMPAPNTNNIIPIVSTAQSVLTTPGTYVCLSCPNFVCGSLQEFMMHRCMMKH